jgi:molybdopterin/thiamine biosynthesis adenylyltransferase
MSNIGRPKAQIATETVGDIDPSIDVSAIVNRVETPEGLKAVCDSEAVILCPDDNQTRVGVHGYCVALGIPLLDIGSGGMLRDGALATFGCRASLFMPGHACLHCVYLDDEPMPHSQISYLPLNLTVVGLGLDMLVAYLTGYRAVRANHVICDFLTGNVDEMMVSSRADCPHCGRGKTRRGERGSIEG